MEIQQIDGESKGYFKAMVSGEEAGRMTYSKVGKDRIIIDHTEVNKAFNGKGVGKNMVLQAVKYARKNNIKIIPLCPFAKSVFNKSPELRDVL